MGQPVAEQNRIKLVRLAVYVEESAGEMGIKEGRAERGHEGEQLLDIGVFRAPERERIEPGRGEKGFRIDAAAMGRVEDQRHFQRLGPRHRKGRRQLGFDRFNLFWAHLPILEQGNRR